MGLWCKSSALVALIVLPQVASPQRAMPPEIPRIEPRIEPRVEPLPGEMKRWDLADPLNGIARDPLGTGFPPALRRQMLLQHQRVSLKLMRQAAARGDWAEVWKESQYVSPRVLTNEWLNLRLRAASALLHDASQADTHSDWKHVRILLGPLVYDKAPAVSENTLLDGPAVGSPGVIDTDRARGERSGSGSVGSGPVLRLGSPDLPTSLDNNPKLSLRFTLDSANALYGRATAQLAEQAVRSGKPAEALELFGEAFATAPQEKSPRTIALYKKASLSLADQNYAARDWQAASNSCEEIQKQEYFSLTAAERVRVLLLQSKSQNWLQAQHLPDSALVLDQVRVGERGFYFQVFGAGGSFDLVVKAATIRELLGHPDFQAAKGQISKGGDLVLTPSVTKSPEWNEALHDAFPDTTLWSDPYISEASEALAAMRQEKLSPANFSVAILLPKNSTQQTAMHLSWTEAQREHAWQAAEYLKENAKEASVVTRSANRTGLFGWVTDWVRTDSKTDVLRSLTDSKGVIVLFAHGDREGIYTPEGKKLTVDDVRTLDLHKNSPVVLLLSCEGNGGGASEASPSLAQALKRSGARAVWSYSQKVDAAEASSVAAKFLEEVRGGKSLLESFRSLSRDSAVKAGPKVHLKVELLRRATHG